MKKCNFTTRLKQCCKEKGYTQDALAKELNISVNGLKRYFRTKNDRLPPLDLPDRMALLLDVDIDYLLGRIDCKKYSQQTIEKITWFYGDIIPLITRASDTYSPKLCSTINLLAKTTDFERLCLLIEELFDIGLFGSDTTVTINTNGNDNFNYAYSEKKSLKS